MWAIWNKYGCGCCLRISLATCMKKGLRMWGQHSGFQFHSSRLMFRAVFFLPLRQMLDRYRTPAWWSCPSTTFPKSAPTGVSPFDCTDVLCSWQETKNGQTSSYCRRTPRMSCNVGRLGFLLTLHARACAFVAVLRCGSAWNPADVTPHCSCKWVVGGVF